MRGCRQTECKKRMLAGFLTVALLLSGCASGRGDGAEGTASQKGAAQTEKSHGDPAAKGRYTEQEIEWAEEKSGREFIGLVPTEKGLYLPDTDYRDGILETKGADPAEGEFPRIRSVGDEELPEVFLRHKGAEDYICSMAMAENGARLYTIFRLLDEKEMEIAYEHCFLDAAGNETRWDADGAVTENDRAYFTYGHDGCFYALVQKSGETNGKVYRVDARNGESKYLTEVEDGWYITVFHDQMFVENGDGLRIIDLETMEQREDKELTELVKDSLGTSNGNFAFGHLLRPGEDDSVYVATDKGLYRHVLYGSVSELLIDGTLCSLGDVSKLFSDLYVAEADESGMPVFYFLYDGGKVVRFAYDPEISSVPENVLTLYSLEPNDDIRLVITAYQAKHPDTYIRYETGMSGEDGVTRADALNDLATRIAAGDGPDLFLTDGLPYSSYAQKGVFADLGGLYDEMKAEHGFFDNIIRAMKTDDKLYTIPMMFNVPVIVGEKEELKKIRNWESFADLIEGADSSKALFQAGVIDPEGALLCLSYTESRKWIKENQTLDKEALKNYLTLCKRIYEADGVGVSEEKRDFRKGFERSYDSRDQSDRMYWMLRSIYITAMNRIAFEDRFSIGILGGDIKSSFNYFYEVLNQTKSPSDYMILPEEKVCIPWVMLSVNSATPSAEEAEDFVRFALTDYLEGSEYLSATPINRDVLLRMEQDNPNAKKDNPLEPYIWHSMGFEGESGEMIRIEVEVKWQEQEVYDRYNAMLDSIDSVNFCEHELLTAVLDNGAPAVRGEKSIEETVDEIAKKIQIYLAE